MNTISSNGVPTLNPEDWDRIHEAVQGVFAGMVQSVRERSPEIRSRAGRTSTRLLPLFSYRIFQLSTAPESDAVVVGLDFKPTDGIVFIRGDICGEETGHVFFDENCEAEVETSCERVLQGALDIANRLAARAEWIPDALASLSQASKQGS